MDIKSNIFQRTYKSSEDISLPYLSVFQYDQVSNKASYERSGLVLCCPNIYNFVLRGDERPQHIAEISRMSDTYKTVTL